MRGEAVIAGIGQTAFGKLPGRSTVSLNIEACRNAVADAGLAPDEVDALTPPLAGLLAGLEHCTTPYLVSVPCDTPNFPLDLVQRLADGLAQNDADIAMAATVENDRQQVQPVFCLLKSSLMESLVTFLHDGHRKIDLWTAQHRCVAVTFEDTDAFFNANTLAELQSLARTR